MAGMRAREQWIADLAGKAAAHLTKDKLEPAPDLVAAGGDDLTKAAIVAAVAAMHERGLLLDSIIQSVIEGRWLAEGVDPGDVAIAGISAYRSCRLMDENWWDAQLLQSSLLECWGDTASRGVDPREAEAHLRDRWLMDAEVASEWGAGLADLGPGPLEEIDRLAGDTPRLSRLLGLDSIETAIEATRDALPEPAKTHARLPDLAAAIAIRDGVLTVAEGLQGAGENDAAEEMRRVSGEIRTALETEIAGISALEVTLVAPLNRSAKVLRGTAEMTRRRLLLVALANALAIPNGISDRFEGVTFVADWQQDLVFSAGARSGLHEWGPSAYLWLALEAHELPEDGDLFPVGVGLVEDADPIELVLTVGPGENPLRMGYRVGHYDGSRRWLALLLLSRRLMFDLFVIEDHELRLLARISQPVDALAEAIEAQVVELIEAEEPEPLITSNELEDHTLTGFSLSENAKSELLLSIATDAGAREENVLRARESLLDAHASRAKALYRRADPTAAERRVEAAMRAYADARSRVDHKARPGRFAGDPDGAHRALVRDFTEGGRAVVHYNFKSDHIQGFWSAHEGESRGWISGEGVDVARLADASKPWLEGAHGDVEELLEAAQPLATELDAALAGTDVDEVVVIPWSLLHGVPFAALPLAGGVLGDRFRVSYAPSLAILRPLLVPGGQRRESIELIAAHGGSLDWADSEIRAAKAIHPGASATPDRSGRAQVLQAMERGRIVHLASHGSWWRDDHFASSLDLRLDDVSNRFVSAAEVHRDLDLNGTELVLLSACNTGRSPAARHGVEFYSGLDAAFLSRGARAVVSTLWPINDLAAMLFMTNLHAELRRGDPLASSFDRSVELLRSGELKNLATDHPIVAPLDAADVEWREAAVRASDLFRAPRIWAAFKLSGVPWMAQPIDE